MGSYILDFMWMFTGLITHYIAYKKGIGRIGRVIYTSLTWYIGPIVIILLFLHSNKPITDIIPPYE